MIGVTPTYRRRPVQAGAIRYSENVLADDILAWARERGGDGVIVPRGQGHDLRHIYEHDNSTYILDDAAPFIAIEGEDGFQRMNEGDWLVYEQGELLVHDHENFEYLYEEQPTTGEVGETAESEESNLVKHARRELEMIETDQDYIRGVIRVVEAFASMGHSGASAALTIPLLDELLSYKNLSPLTDNPSEWMYHGVDTWGEEGGIWQNVRNGEAFSKDGGVTYYLLSEPLNSDGKPIFHTSKVVTTPTEEAPE